jgi:hypothetical protein
MEESFYATVKLIVMESNKNQIRLIVKQLMSLGAVDEETGEAVILGTECLK